MFGGWQAAPVEAERPPRHEAAPMMSTDPRSLAALLHEFVIHEALLRYRLTERFTGFANVTSLTGPFRGPVLALVYARHGRELMGCKSPVQESSHCRETG